MSVPYLPPGTDRTRNSGKPLENQADFDPFSVALCRTISVDIAWLFRPGNGRFTGEIIHITHNRGKKKGSQSALFCTSISNTARPPSVA